VSFLNKTFHVNDLSSLHDGEKIFFCKRDWVEDEFRIIEKVPNDVVLIVGNSDFVYDEDLLGKTPSNVKVVFAQNGISLSPRVVTIPIGLDNTHHSHRGSHHGWGWGEKSQLVALSRLSKEEIDSAPSKFIYSNFRLYTNSDIRVPIQEIVKKLDFITHEESTPPGIDSTILFQRRILEHRAVICPEGSGPDTHRFYETLYLNRIPITFSSTLYKKVHHLFPVVLIEDLELLKDKNYLDEKISEQENITWDRSALTPEYWKKKILEYIKQT
jgi:hypothetical protein